MKGRLRFGPQIRLALLDPRIVQDLEYLENPTNPQKQNVTLAAAEAANLSVSRVQHLFRQQVGMPLGRYNKSLRLRKARTLLQSSFLTLKQIAFQVGLNDISHFVRDYKLAYGERPSETRADRRNLPKLTNARAGTFSAAAYRANSIRQKAALEQPEAEWSVSMPVRSSRLSAQSKPARSSVRA